MKYLQVINLNKYQHYSDRPNIWIKWYQKSLEDYKFQQLRDRERWLFVGIIMLAVNSGNKVPLDPQWVRARVCHIGSEGGGEGVSGVAVSIEKMIKLRLLCTLNASIDKKERKKERESLNNNGETCKEKEELRSFVKGGFKIKKM